MTRTALLHPDPLGAPAPAPQLALAPDPLAGHGHRLARAAEALLDRPPPPPPDTGATAEATRHHLAAVASRSRRVADDARALAGALDRVVDLLRDADDGVASAFARVSAGPR